MNRIDTALTKPGGLRPWHFVLTTCLCVTVILAYSVFLVVGTLVTVQHLYGSSAARPGVPLVPGTQPVAATSGIGSAAAASNREGGGAGWCSSVGGHPLGASYHGVYACGPAQGVASVFDSAGFQCVELSVRYAYVVFGYRVVNVPNGRLTALAMSEQTHKPLGQPGVSSVPSPGDVVSMWGGPHADGNGHTAIVTRVSVNRAGNGRVDVLEENGSVDGRDHLDVRSWQETFGDPFFAGGLYYYDHIQWVKLAPVAKPFNLKLWTRWTRHHHRHARPHLFHRHLSWQASVWSRHPWRYWGAVNGPTWHPKRHRHGAGYDLMRFQTGEMMCWPKYHRCRFRRLKFLR